MEARNDGGAVENAFKCLIVVCQTIKDQLEESCTCDSESCKPIK